VLDLLERALVLDELDGSPAVTTGGRVVLLAGEARLQDEQLGALGSVRTPSAGLVLSRSPRRNTQSRLLWRYPSVM
jgi:hypothetical protein